LYWEHEPIANRARLIGQEGANRDYDHAQGHSAVSAAAALVGIFFIVPLTPSLEAHVPEAGAKTDRLDLKTYGSECSQRGWPHFETHCLRDTASPTRKAKSVRVVTADRLN
jgi:hypothetical protein